MENYFYREVDFGMLARGDEVTCAICEQPFEHDNRVFLIEEGTWNDAGPNFDTTTRRAYVHAGCVEEREPVKVAVIFHQGVAEAARATHRDTQVFVVETNPSSGADTLDWEGARVEAFQVETTPFSEDQPVDDLVEVLEEKRKKDEITLAPRRFAQKARTFIGILNETIRLLEDDQKLANLKVNEASTEQLSDRTGVNLHDPKDFLAYSLDALDHDIGTLAIEIEQNLNQALAGQIDLNTGQQYQLE